MRVLLRSLLILTIMFVPTRVNAQLSQLTVIAALIKEVSSAFEKIATSLENGLKSTMRTVDLFEARSSLADLEKVADNILEFGNPKFDFMNAFDRYLQGPNDNNWSQLQEEVPKMLGAVRNLASNIKRRQKSLLRLTGTQVVDDLLNTLRRRDAILKQLQRTPRPTQPPELEQLQIVRDRYMELYENLRRVRNALDEFIVRGKSRRSSADEGGHEQTGAYARTALLGNGMSFPNPSGLGDGVSPPWACA